MDQLDAAAALAAAAHRINEQPGVGETLDAIAQAALETVPGIDHVGVSVAHRDGTMQTLAATDDLVRRLDRLQFELGEGPCVHAMRHHSLVEVQLLAQEDRWPRFVAAAREEGLRAQIGINLYCDRDAFGGLNLYSTSRDAFEPGTAHIVELFAAHAAFGLGRSRREEQLYTAIANRKVIGQAIGILMQRYGLNEERAFAFLTRASMSSNVKVRAVAQKLVDECNRRGGAGG